MASLNTCPMCTSREIGKINRGRYFCRECCHEWTIEGEGHITVYRITSEGAVVRLRPKVNNSTCRPTSAAM